MKESFDVDDLKDFKLLRNYINEKNINKQFFKINHFINANACKKIIKEIDNFEKYDDLVMSGRKRINKGSINFNKFLKNSITSRKFFSKINNFKFFKTIKTNLINNSKKKMSGIIMLQI